MAHSTSRHLCTFGALAAGLSLAGGCASPQASPTATIEPDPTGNEQMDQMLNWLAEIDAQESGSFDLEAAAKQDAQNTRAGSGGASPPNWLRSGDLPDQGETQDATQVAAEQVAGEQIAQPVSSVPVVFLDDPEPVEVKATAFSPPVAQANDGFPIGESSDHAEGEQLSLAEQVIAAIQDESDEHKRYRTALAVASVSPIASIPRPDGTELSPEAKTVVDGIFELQSALAGLGDQPDLDTAADAAASFAATLSADLPLRITHAALCTRVDGFGQYRPLREPKFLAGKPGPMIVYVEIDRFAHTSVTSAYRGPGPGPAPQWQVRLSQDLELFAAGQTVPVWTKPAETLTDMSRNKRRDFHVTHSITLPPSLALGVYELKITMRDLVSGAMDQKTVQIQVVSNPSLISTD